jgi:hypothetical protein
MSVMIVRFMFPPSLPVLKQRPDYRQRKRQNPERAKVRPTSLFLARRVIRFGFPEATVSMSLEIRALR